MTVESQVRGRNRGNRLNISGEDQSTELSILDSPVSTKSAANPEDINAMVAAMNAAVLDTTDPNFIRNQIETLGSTTFDRINRDRGVQAVINSFRQEVNEAIESQQIDKLIEAENKRQKAVEEISNSGAPEAFTASLSNPETENKIAEAKLNQRIVLFDKIIKKMVKKNTPGIIGGIGDFADMMISGPFDALGFGGFERTDAAKRITNLMVADMPMEQLERELRSVIQEGMDAGLFTDSNYFYLGSIVDNIYQRGKGAEADLDRFFNLLDLGGIAGAAVSGSARALRGARTGGELASATAGPKAGGRIVADAAANPDNVENAKAMGVPQASPSVMRHPRNFNDHKQWYLPGMEVFARLNYENSYLNLVRSHNFSQRINPEVFEQWKPIGLQRLREEIDATKHSRILDLDINADDAGNIFGTILFGKKNGMPFTDKGSAIKAERQLNGRLESVPNLKSPVTEDTALGGQNFYFVRVEKNIPAGDLVKPLTNEEIGQVYWEIIDDAKLLGGSFLSIPRSLDSVAKRGEGVFSRVAKDISKRLKKKIKATPKEDVKFVERVVHDLRDGESSWRRDWYDEGEFISEFAVKSNGRKPSQAAIDLYFDIQELNDSFYLLKADQLFKKAVDKGYTEAVQFTRARSTGEVDEYALPAKKISAEEVPDNNLVFNPISGERFTKDQLNRNHTVFRLSDIFEEGDEDFRFVVFEQPRTRRLHHTDVLGYNPGGTRIYETMKYTVKQDRRGGRPRTILGTETLDEARKATTQINDILRAARDQIPGFSALGRAAKIDAIDDLGDNLTDVIRRNNEFDPSIESTGEFTAFLRTQRIDPSENVGFARLNEKVLTEDDSGNLLHLGGDDFQEILETNFNVPSSAGPRRDVPLRGYGNNMLETKSPIEAIQNDYMRVLHNKAFSAFHFQAINGWLNGEARGFIKNLDEIAGMDPLRAMNEAKFSNENLKEVRNFKAARAAINRILNTKTGYEQMWDSMVDRVVDFTFQKDLKKIGKFTDRNARDPATKIRSFAFDIALGLFAFPQLMVQASHIVSQLAIVGLKRTPEFFQAAVTHIPLRIALFSPDNKEFVRMVGHLTRPFTGMSADEFEEFTKWVHNSGRLEIGGEVAEVSADMSKVSRGFLSKTREAGRIFFNEGEKIPRSTGLRLAWNEYKRAFPKSDLNSEHAVQWITARQDALFAAMTRASRSELQRGPQSVTFQFFTYTQRMKEMLFTNRMLSADERKRLAIAQFFFWGASGVGLGRVVDNAVTTGEFAGMPVPDMSEFEYTALKYGLLNAVVNEAVGTQRVAFGERLAPAGAIADFMRKLSDNNFDEILGGPALEMTKDVWQRIPQLTRSIFSGNATVSLIDVRKMLQNTSSFNKSYQAWHIALTGDYVSKNGNRIVSGLTDTDAIMVFLGNQVQDSDLTFSRTELLRDQKEHIRTHGNRLKELMLEFQTALRDDRPHEAEEIGEYIAKEMAILPPYVRRQVQRDMDPQLRTMMEEVFDKVRRQGLAYDGSFTRDNE